MSPTSRRARPAAAMPAGENSFNATTTNRRPSAPACTPTPRPATRSWSITANKVCFGKSTPRATRTRSSHRPARSFRSWSDEKLSKNAVAPCGGGRCAVSAARESSGDWRAERQRQQDDEQQIGRPWRTCTTSPSVIACSTKRSCRAASSSDNRGCFPGAPKGFGSGAPGISIQLDLQPVGIPEAALLAQFAQPRRTRAQRPSGRAFGH